MRKSLGDLSQPFTVGSLFSGIGGLDLGLERAGMQIKWMVEQDAFCRSVLGAQWPGVPIYKNVKHKFNGLEHVDLVAGGFPCQPVSNAGKRLHDQDERWLWPQMLRVIEIVQPRWVLVENVEGLRTKGLGDVLEGLASLGFDAEWHRVSASAVGAPHRRRRYFVVGYPTGAFQERAVFAANGGSERLNWDKNLQGCWGVQAKRRKALSEFGDGIGSQSHFVVNSKLRRHEGKFSVTIKEWCEETGTIKRCIAPIADTSSERRQQIATGAFGDEEADGRQPQVDHIAAGASQERFSIDWGEYEAAVRRWEAISGRQSPQPLVRRVDDGFSRGLALGTLIDELKALGNAVVPQVAEYVGRLILDADRRLR